jgi:MoxR-like ATPase
MDDMPQNLPSSEPSVEQADRYSALLNEAREDIASVIFGQDQVIDLMLTTVLAGGHALLVGTPGLAKTKLVHTLATVLGLDTSRVQFTPDLLPTDILGAEILEQGKDGSRAFRFVQGPVFTQLLMADEINRASPRTQSALLQAMQEYEVTIAGQAHQLPRPFHVLATQNPLEQEGTYPLPEAQLDRFMMQIDIDYPDRAAEKTMLAATTGGEDKGVRKHLSAELLQEIQSFIRTMPVGESVVEAILDIVRAARPVTPAQGAGTPPFEDLKTLKASDLSQFFSWGAGPRASQTLMLATRAKALLDGRYAPNLQDVEELALPVLIHRCALTYQARAQGFELKDVLKILIQRES